MRKAFCPFRHRCPHRPACQDHWWLCFWVFWVAIVAGVVGVSLLFWRSGLV